MANARLLEEKKEPVSLFQTPQSLFGKTAETPKLIELATLVGTLIFRGEHIDKAVALTKKYPDILRCPVTVHDFSGSPELCFSWKLEPPNYDVYMLNKEYKLSYGKEDQSPFKFNTIYVEPVSKSQLRYKIRMTYSYLHTATIEASQLKPPINFNEEFNSEVLRKYRSQILKIALKRGHIRNEFQVTVRDNKTLQYAGYTHEGNFIKDYIDLPQELYDEFRCGRRPQCVLNELKHFIFAITSQRGHTPVGRAIVDKTPFQIALIAGDKDLVSGITDVKQHGAAEQLRFAGNLSDIEVIEQREEAMTGEEARAENTERNFRAQTVFVNFVKRLRAAPYFRFSNTTSDPDLDASELFKGEQGGYQSIIDKYQEELDNVTRVVKAGYLFDPDNLVWAADFLVKFRKKHFMTGNVCLMHTIIGLGSFQKKLSARDKQVIFYGATNLLPIEQIKKMGFAPVIPPRSLYNEMGEFYARKYEPYLGYEYYFGIAGWTKEARSEDWDYENDMRDISTYMKMYIRQKAEASAVPELRDSSCSQHKAAKLVK